MTRTLTLPLDTSPRENARIPWRDRAFWAVFSRIPVFTILFEDPDVEERFFQVNASARVLSVSAAGCGIASLLASHPEHIDAVDGNGHHLALTALKVAAAQRLEWHADLYALFGHGRHEAPEQLIASLTASLPDWIRAYWARRSTVFRRGLYQSSLSTWLFAVLRAITGLDEAWMRRMLSLSTDARVAEIERLYARALKHPAFLLAARSPILLLGTGINFRQRDRNLSGVGAADMTRVLLETGKRIAATDLETNWIFWHVMRGQFNHDHPDARPPYLRASHHARSLAAPTTVAYHHRSFLEVLADATSDTWTHYNFSDALDWLDDTLQRRVLTEVIRTSRPGALLLVRSVEPSCMVKRLGLERWFSRLDIESDAATAMDRSGLYRRVDLYRVTR